MLILRDSDGLASPVKDAKENLLLNFWARAE